MVTLCRLAAPQDDAPGTGGTTIARTKATSPRVATLNKKYNNPLANLATSVMQGLKARPHLRQLMMLPRLILGKRSMMAATCGASLRQGEGTVPTGTTTTTTMTASPALPPTSLKILPEGF
jgi:hypothetical protein